MLGNHARLVRILFVVIFVKLFILLVLVGVNRTDESKPHRSRRLVIDELLIDKREGKIEVKNFWQASGID